MWLSRSGPGDITHLQSSCAVRHQARAMTRYDTRYYKIYEQVYSLTTSCSFCFGARALRQLTMIFSQKHIKHWSS